MDLLVQSIFLAIPGPASVALIVVVVLLLFGGKKIPELMRGLGSGIKEFKDATKEDEQLNEGKKESSSND
jgi:sec-independent protein translocase protein TatA